MPMNLINHLQSSVSEMAMVRLNTNMVLVFDAVWIAIVLLIICAILLSLILALMVFRTFFKKETQKGKPQILKKEENRQIPKKTPEPWSWEVK